LRKKIPKTLIFAALLQHLRMFLKFLAQEHFENHVFYNEFGIFLRKKISRKFSNVAKMIYKSTFLEFSCARKLQENSVEKCQFRRFSYQLFIYMHAIYIYIAIYM